MWNPQIWRTDYISCWMLTTFLASFQAFNPCSNPKRKVALWPFHRGHCWGTERSTTHSLEVRQLVHSRVRIWTSNVAPEQPTMTTPRGQSQPLESGQGVLSVVSQERAHPSLPWGLLFLVGGNGPRCYALWGNWTATRKMTHKLETECWLPLWIPPYFTSLP